jgi:pimeloyl-ACP methyl ester carboxylesterase
VALLALPVLIGATYQGVATALERREFARPGGLVDVGDHQLHILCTGEGAPTVVLEAAAGAASPAWGLVQPAISQRARVCSYDRAALAWSEAGDGGYAPGRVPDELHALLGAAGEPGPFVLVGHEIGRAFARTFAVRYPDEVVALVEVAEADAGQAAASPWAWAWLARAGVLRLTGTLEALADGLPDRPGGAMRAFLNRPDHLTRAALELTSAAAVTAAAPDLPAGSPLDVSTVTVATRGRPAIITTPRDADAVTRAVVEALARVHARGGTTPPEP